MIKSFLFATGLLLFGVVHAQVGINSSGGPPDPSAGLEVDFSDKGFLLPRLSTSERNAISNPATGLQIFNTDCNVINYNAGTPSSPDWVVVSASNALAMGLIITSNPSGSVCNGSSITYSASVSNGGNSPDFQWKRNGQNIPGENDPVYVNNAPDDGDVITCVVTSSEPCVIGSPVVSNSITEMVDPLLSASVTIMASPSGAICAGDNVLFTASPTNGGLVPAFQWKKNGVGIPGENSSSYSSSSLSNGDEITCVMTSALSCVSGSPALSNPIELTVNPIPSSAFSPGSGFTGNAITFDPVTNGAQYVWTFEDGSIPSSTLENPSVTWNSPATYDITLSVTLNGCESETQDNITIVTPTVVTFNANGSYQTGTVQTFTVPNGVSNLTIEAYGAQGAGHPPGEGDGGKGAYIKGDFTVTPGDVLNILVGQTGNQLNNNSFGGGGGSFVWINPSTLLIAAGGGGGAGINVTGSNGGDGSATQSATPGNNFGGASGGTGGNGGSGGASTGGAYGGSGGGAGWLSDGSNGAAGSNQNPGGGGGQRPQSGGYGGNAGASWGCVGGYGGGGGGGLSGGGGGGYNGGGGGNSYPITIGPNTSSGSGGGGGSFNGGTNQANTSGFQIGNGKVVITY